MNLYIFIFHDILFIFVFSIFVMINLIYFPLQMACHDFDVR